MHEVGEASAHQLVLAAVALPVIATRCPLTADRPVMVNVDVVLDVLIRVLPVKAWTRHW